MADVKVVKLANGLEIIAKVVSESETEIVVDSPLTLQAMRDGASGISVGLVPFSWAGIASNVVLSKTHILCVMLPEPQIQTQYLAGLAGISLPQPNTGTERPKLTLVE